MPKKILVIGESLIDIINVSPNKEEYNLGGNALNTVCALGSLGEEVSILTMVGDDIWGKEIIDNFETFGVNTEYVHIVENQQTIWTNIANRKVIYHTPAKINWNQPSDIEAFIDQFDIIHFASVLSLSKIKGNYKDYRKLLKAAIVLEKFISIALNYREFVWETSGESYVENCQIFLAAADIVFLNYRELKLIAKDMSISSTIVKMTENGRRPIIFVTEGKSGSRVFINGQENYVPIFDTKTEIKYRVGAGDVYAAAVLHKFSQSNLQLVKTKDIISVGEFASKFVASVLGGFGITSRLSN